MRLILLSALGLVPFVAAASGGVFEINQSCAQIGCFAGDDPGFPVSINHPGSYELTSNLAVTTTSAVLINTSGVQLNLRGFTVSGAVTCTGSPAVCVPDLSVNSHGGVNAAASTEGVVIRNGLVRGFSVGVFSSVSGLVEDVVATENSNSGVVGREGATIRRVSANRNGRMGIEIGIGGEIADSSAADNGQFGMATGGVPDNGGAAIRNSSAYRNGGEGIYDWGRSLIDGVVANDNRGVGLRIGNGGSLVRNSIFTGNDGVGIEVQGGTAFEPGGVRTALSGNTLTGNNGGSGSPQISSASSVFHVTPSLCASAACP